MVGFLLLLIDYTYKDVTPPLIIRKNLGLPIYLCYFYDYHYFVYECVLKYFRFSILFRISPIILFYVPLLDRLLKVFTSLLHLFNNLFTYFCFHHIHIYWVNSGNSIYTAQIRVSGISTYSFLLLEFSSDFSYLALRIML